MLETPEVWRLDCAQFGKTSIREITIEEIQRAEHSTALASVAALLTAACQRETAVDDGMALFALAILMDHTRLFPPAITKTVS